MDRAPMRRFGSLRREAATEGPERFGFQARGNERRSEEPPQEGEKDAGRPQEAGEGRPARARPSRAELAQSDARRRARDRRSGMARIAGGVLQVGDDREL